MWSSGPNYNKLKTNLRLAVNRLKLLEKKKTELAQKARKEIADYISANKAERAKIRVEHIIREDYLVEAMEIVECYCDMLLARMGLIQQMKTLDEGLAEPISSILWVAPRLEADVAELKVIAYQLGLKYGKDYVQASRDNSINTVSPKLMHKLAVQAPPKILVERYLIEIARNYNVPYEPDPQVMKDDELHGADGLLIDLNDLNRGDGSGGGPSGGGSGPSGGGSGPSFGGGGGGGGGFNLPVVPSGGFDAPPPPLGFVDPAMKPPLLPEAGPAAPPPVMPYVPPGGAYNPYDPKTSNLNYPTPAPRSKAEDALNLPEVPAGLGGLPSPGPPPTAGMPPPDDEANFDDLTKRFEALKKRK